LAGRHPEVRALRTVVVINTKCKNRHTAEKGFNFPGGAEKIIKLFRNRSFSLSSLSTPHQIVGSKTNTVTMNPSTLSASVEPDRRGPCWLLGGNCSDRRAPTFIVEAVNRSVDRHQQSTAPGSSEATCSRKPNRQKRYEWDEWGGRTHMSLIRASEPWDVEYSLCCIRKTFGLTRHKARLTHANEPSLLQIMCQAVRS
jgi:hypothetical protein